MHFYLAIPNKPFFWRWQDGTARAGGKCCHLSIWITPNSDEKQSAFSLRYNVISIDFLWLVLDGCVQAARDGPLKEVKEGSALPEEEL